jgi:hypothetical protein
MAKGEEVWNPLQEGEAKSIWDETENNFWTDLRSKEEAANREIEKNFQDLRSEASLNLNDVRKKRNQLKESQSRLAKEFAQVETKLACTADECDEKAERLVRIEEEYRESRRKRRNAQNDIWVKMRRFFREKRGEDPDVPDDKGPESEGIVLPDALPEMPSPSKGPVPQKEPINGSTTGETMRVRLAQMQQPAAQHTREIKQEASGFSEFPPSMSMPYHPLQQPQERQPNKRPETLSKQVNIPPSYGAIESQLEPISNHDTRSLYDVPCGSNTSSTFPRVPMAVMEPHAQHQENASWAVGNPPGGPLSRSATARGRDHTPKGADDPGGATQFDHTQPPTRPLHEAPRPTLGPVGTRDISHGYHGLSLEPNNLMETSHGFESRRTPCESGPVSTPNDNWTDLRFAPADTVKPLASPERHVSAPISLQIDPSPQPPATLGEITRANLVLQIDGPVYTSPDCVKGVPLVKIGKDHSYWEDSWEDIRSLIVPEIAKWQSKYEAAMSGTPGQSMSESALNRCRGKMRDGYDILTFLGTGPISPYQLLSKSFINCKKHNITGYDTLCRLVKTLSELENFDLDISPVDWVRQRLHELIEVQGTRFKLPKAINSFYNDPKLVDLRSKHGRKTLGGPTTAMKSLSSNRNSNAAPKPSQKRKHIHQDTGISTLQEPVDVEPYKRRKQQ